MIRALALALALAGCGDIPAPTWGLPRDDGPHYRSTDDGDDVAERIAQRRAEAIDRLDRAAERQWRARVLRALEDD